MIAVSLGAGQVVGTLERAEEIDGVTGTVALDPFSDQVFDPEQGGWWNLGEYLRHYPQFEFLRHIYTAETLDPRPIPSAAAANEKVFAKPVYGIEVTVPALAKRCTFNLDPQHAGGDANRAAIEDSLTIELPTEGSTLATVRADLDSVGAMAVFSLRAKGVSLEPAMNRVALVAMADKFARGGWPGPTPLPSRGNPWHEETATAESSCELAAIAAAVVDFKVPLVVRVSEMETWLLSGVEPRGYRNKVEAERLDLIEAIESGAVRHEVRADGQIALVESTHRAATSLGYSMAPVVVALNPEFRLGGGEPHHKFTVCQYRAGHVDLGAVCAELNQLEPGWGGSPTIVGSPQGVSSALSVEQVVEVVHKHLI